MNITQIKASGVSGGSFDYLLSPLTIFKGPRGSGKSTALQLLCVALSGHLARLGKTNAATFLLSNGSDMEVQAAFSNGAMAHRRFYGQNGGTVSQEQVNVPDFLKEPLPLLDSTAYFSMTADQQRQYVFSVATMPDTYKAEKILADLADLDLPKDDNTAAAREIVTDLVRKALAKHGIADGLQELNLTKKGILPVQFTEFRARAKQTLDTQRVLAELKNRQSDYSAETVSAIDEEIKTLQAELGEANKEKGALEERRKAALKNKERREGIEEALNRPAVDVAKDIADAKKKVAELRKSITAESDDVKGLRELFQDARSVAATLEQKLDQAGEDLKKIRSSISDLNEKQECPYCLCSGEGWRETIRQKYELREAALAATVLELTGGLAAQNASLKTQRDRLDKCAKAAEDNQAASAKIGALEKTILRLQQRASNDRILRDGLEKELTNIGSTSFDAQEALDEAKARVEKADDAADDASTRKTAALRLQQDLVRAEQAAQEYFKAAAMVEVITAFGKALKAKQSEMISELFGTLLKTANYFTVPVLGITLAFQDGEIGYFLDGKFVNHRTFSGTEQAVTYVAIAVALSENAPFKTLILDEVDIDADTEQVLMNRIADAQKEGIIDQAILARSDTPKKSRPVPEGWQAIFLNRGGK